MSKGFLGLPWPLWAALALGVALLFAWLTPSASLADATGLRRLILRWGHSMVWLLLALSFLLRSREAWLPLAGPVGAAAGLLYAAFLFALVSR